MLECLAVRAAQVRMEMRYYMVHSIYLLYMQGPTDLQCRGKVHKKGIRSSDDYCILVKI